MIYEQDRASVLDVAPLLRSFPCSTAITCRCRSTWSKLANGYPIPFRKRLRCEAEKFIIEPLFRSNRRLPVLRPAFCHEKALDIIVELYSQIRYSSRDRSGRNLSVPGITVIINLLSSATACELPLQTSA